jgi:hypothetical protein
MAGLGGIIAGALGGAGAAYAESAQGELKNQQRMDLEKELANVAFERDQRVKEADVMRSRSNTKYNQSEAVLKEASVADRLKALLGLENRTAIAPEAAAAATAEDTAMTPLATTQRERAIQAEIDKAKTLGGSSEYLAGTAAVSKAQKAAEIETATIRAEKAGGGAGGGALKVRSTKVDDAGNMIAIMSDGSTKPLGIKSGDYNNKIASTIATMAKNDYKFSKLPESEKRAAALERLTGVKVDGGSSAEGPTGGSKLPPLGDSKYVTK